MPHQYTILADFITLPRLVTHWYVGTSTPERMVPYGGYDGGKCGSLKENVWLTRGSKVLRLEGSRCFILQLSITRISLHYEYASAVMMG